MNIDICIAKKEHIGAELHAQAVSFEEIALELMLEREHWSNPELLLA
jgi:hypothetical protein